MPTRTLESHNPSSETASEASNKLVSNVDISALQGIEEPTETKKPVHGEDGVCCGGCGG